jgi:hypothetical protein
MLIPRPRGRRRAGRVAWCPIPTMGGVRLVSELGRNAHGEPLDPGRVSDCYLALPCPPGDRPGQGGVLIVAPRALLHPSVPQPAGSLLYELVTGHPDRQSHELVFPADLAVELRAWPRERWAARGVDLEQLAAAVVSCWQRGDTLGLELPLNTSEEARAVTRPAMTLARAALRARLARQVAHAHRRWLHPSSRRQTGDRFL